MLGVAAVALLALPAGAEASVGEQRPFCVPALPPCIESVTRNGVAVTEEDPDYEVRLFYFPPDPGQFTQLLSWSIIDRSDTYLGLGSLSDVWQVTIRTGPVVPRLTDTRGGQVSVAREEDPAGWRVQTTAKPVVMAEGCDQSVWPWSCPEIADEMREGYLTQAISDLGDFPPRARAKFFGYDHGTNIAAGEVPPQVRDNGDDPDTLVVNFANPHFWADGSTVFTGEFNIRIPTSVYAGITNPEELATTHIDTDLSGSGAGTVSVNLSPGGEFIELEGSGLTFSARRLRVRAGDPLRPPKRVRTKRVSRKKGRITFKEPRSAGFAIRGYEARCKVTGQPAIRKRAKRSPIRIKGLRPRTKYACGVRTRSSIGKSKYSKPKIL